MSSLIPFDFETNAVRVVMQDDEPWFVAADVCRCLEIANPRDAVSRLDDDEKGVGIADTLGGRQSLNIVSESGLYALIFTSRLPAAKRFRRWVTAEVLPAIRRDGRYVMADGNDLPAKRSRFQGMRPESREKAEIKAEAVARIQRMIEQGSRVGAAVAEVAQDVGLSERTLYSARLATWMVPRSDWAAALAHKGAPRGMTALCHPEAMRHFLGLVAAGWRVSDSYRQTVQIADENGWLPVAPERTMYRLAQRALPRPVPRPPKSKEAA